MEIQSGDHISGSSNLIKFEGHEAYGLGSGKEVKL